MAELRGVRALVRVAVNEPGEIGVMSDAGASGIVCPHVDTRTEAEVLVASRRYPPLGRRSFGAFGASLLGRPQSPAEGGARVQAIAIVASATAVRNLDDIVRTPSLGTVLGGFADRAISVGRMFSGYDGHGTREAATTIAGPARDAGITFGVPAVGPESRAFVTGPDPDMLILGSDIDFLLFGGGEALRAARAGS
jgi:4-hydroxy-2-oxoheptanedioate aldolase